MEEKLSNEHFYKPIVKFIAGKPREDAAPRDLSHSHFIFMKRKMQLRQRELKSDSAIKKD